MNLPRSRQAARAGVRWISLAALAGTVTCALPCLAGEAGSVDPVRGRLLYEAHCDACHSTNMHWRKPSIVKSWADLLVQVTRWQANAGQRWTQAEIADVATYLNDRFYQLPCPPAECAVRSAGLTHGIARTDP